MAKYELLTVFPGTFAEDELPSHMNAISDAITEQGGTDIHINNMGKNRLAYPMKHIRYGYFSQFIFTIESQNIPVLQQKLTLIPDLLRAMVHSYDETKQQTYNDRMAELRAQGDKAPTKEDQEDEAEEVEQKPQQAKEDQAETKETNIEEIDKKLDEILDQSIAEA